MDEAWLTTVRLARECGDISSLFPPGVKRLLDLPHTIFTAIHSALVFLGYRENVLDKKDTPPKAIWLNPEKIEQWFREVEEAHKAKARGDGDVRDMPQNELMKQMFPGASFG